MKENGKLIEIVNPQPEVRRNAEEAYDWEFKEEAAYLNEKAVALRERLIDPIARIHRSQLPDPVIGFDNLRNYKVLAEYLVVRDAIGLSCRINFNTEHYISGDNGKLVWRWGRWAQLETLVHEYVHLWEQQVGSGRPSHAMQFIDKCESIGLHPLLGIGCHIAVADEPFSIVMREWGIDRPSDVPTADGKSDWFKNGKELKGRSSLHKWTCPECGLNVRMGIVGDPMLRHHTCEEAVGRPVFLIPGDVYIAKK